MRENAVFDGKCVELLGFLEGFGGFEKRKMEALREVLVEGVERCYFLHFG